MTNDYVYFVHDKEDAYASREFADRKELEAYLSGSDFLGYVVEDVVDVYYGKRVEVKSISKVVVGEPK